MKRVLSAVRKSWCYSMHPAPMWPINGYYVCPRCQARHEVPWEKANFGTEPQLEAAKGREVPSNAVQAEQVLQSVARKPFRVVL